MLYGIDYLIVLQTFFVATLFTTQDNMAMKEKTTGGGTHRVLEIEKVLCTNDIPILPNCYMTNQISRKESITLVDQGINDDRECNQRNNLICSAEQIPDREFSVISNNGWGHVIQKPKCSQKKEAPRRITKFYHTDTTGTGI